MTHLGFKLYMSNTLMLNFELYIETFYSERSWYHIFFLENKFVEISKHDMFREELVFAFASPASFSFGDSRFLLEEWCQEDKNKLVLTGFVLQNMITRELAKKYGLIGTRKGTNINICICI